MYFLVCIICLLASTIGGICGIGGGVIIKPSIDALSIMSVSSISFLSGLTVLSMSLVSVFRQRKQKLIEKKSITPLALGAAIGGILGSLLFKALKDSFGNDTVIGIIQSIALALITLLTLIYSIFLKTKIKSYNIRNKYICTIIGLFMGIMSSFLGIGGGPINLAVLYFFFSMDAKKAAGNSLYIILISQTANFITTIISGSVPSFDWVYLLLMVSCGIAGGLLGSYVYKKISIKTTEKLFAILLIIIILICIYNALKVPMVNG